MRIGLQARFYMFLLFTHASLFHFSFPPPFPPPSSLHLAPCRCPLRLIQGVYLHSPFLGDNKGCFLGFLTKEGDKGILFPKICVLDPWFLRVKSSAKLAPQFYAGLVLDLRDALSPKFLRRWQADPTYTRRAANNDKYKAATSPPPWRTLLPPQEQRLPALPKALQQLNAKINIQKVTRVCVG